MALIEETVRSHLLGDSAITARVSNQIFASDVVPQGTSGEYITYRKIGGGNFEHQEGGGGIAETILTLTAFSGSGNAAGLMDLVRLRCDGWRGATGSGGAAGTVRIMRTRDPRASAEPPLPGAEPSAFRDTRELRVVHVIAEATQS